MRLGTSTVWALASLLGIFAAGCGDDTGGAGGGGGDDASTSADTSSASTADASASSGSAASGSTGASGLDVPGGPGPGAKPEYAPGPYGTNVGAVVENFSFVGYSQPHTDRADLEVLTMADFYNPTGDGVFPADGRAWAGMPKPRALSVSVAAYWCQPCRDESEETIPAVKSTQGPNGAEFLLLLSDGNAGNVPPVLGELDAWVERYAMTVPAALDPGPVFQPVWDANAYPENILIRTSDMRIIAKVAGAPPLSDPYWSEMQAILAAPLP
jgi:hypothetical protein